MIGLIDYGSGNIHAIATIYHRLNIPFELVRTPDRIQAADKLILPGVGAFDETVTMIRNLGITEVLNEEVLQRRKPILGVCVGMQLLAEGSDEGRLPGFGWIPGRVRKFDKSGFGVKPHLPHMGWNAIRPSRATTLFEGVDLDRGFYFLHSYYFECSNQEDILAESDYPEAFASAVQHENVYGMQFHPEKSHHNGVALLQNFAAQG